MDKKISRKNISEKRDNLIERETLDRKIIKKFINLKEYKEAENICIYVNYKSEINTKINKIVINTPFRILFINTWLGS